MGPIDNLIKSNVNNNICITGFIGVTVTRTPVTKTIDGTYGSETLTPGTDEDIICFISLDFKKTNRYFVTKEGQVESGDAFILVKPTQALNKDDIITYDSRKYRVADIYRMMVNNTLTGIQGNLFLIE